MRFVSFSIPGPTGRSAFRRLVQLMLMPVGAFLLLSFAGLSSSSEADEPLFTRSAQQLERLWSGVLGCTYPDGAAPRGTFETTLDGSGVPSAVKHDYVECGRLALRNASSRLLVDTVEEALHRGGAALFEERFRLDSGIGWAWGESITGEIDAVIPLYGERFSDGTEQAFFLQPGAVFWPGLESENRMDANFGLVYRRQFTPDFIVGGSAFYDQDLKRGHRRLGIGADLQSGVIHTALNYYHPLNDWQEGRTDYVEQPLQGADFRLGFAQSRLRIDTSLGIWRFEGEEEESAKWRRAFELEAGYRIYPGVFLQGGYERHDSGDSLGSRWNAGIAFRFTLPEFEGAASDESMEQPDLWEPVEREKRVLYEERLDFSVRLIIEDAVIAEPGNSGGRPATTTVTGVISGRNLREDETIEVVIHESTTAEHGEGNDFTFSQRIYGVDGQTGGQVTPAGSAVCLASPCRMEIPANLTARTVEIEVSALADSVEREIPEFVDLRIDIRDGSSNLVHSSNVARVTIGAHGNTVGFDGDNSDGELMENGGEAGVTVEIEEPLLAPVTLQIGTGGTAERGTDYRVPTSLAIPAGAGSVSLALTGIDNDRSEGNKTITLTLSGGLPDGWDFADVEHEITLRDDDLNIGFELSNPTLVEESVSTVELRVAANQPLTGAARIAWSVTEGAGDIAGGSTSGELNFSEGNDETNPQTIAIDVNDDTDPENAERVTVTLDEAGATLPEGWSLGVVSHTFTIEPSDGTITLVSTDPVTANEGDTVGIDITSTVDAPSRGFPLTVSFAPFAADDIDFPATFRFPAGERSHSFPITINSDGVPENAETFTMSLGQDEDSEDFPDDWTTVSGTRTININPSGRTIGFVGEDVSLSESGSAGEVAVVITPVPLEDVVIPLAIAGDGDAYLPGGSGTISGNAQTGLTQTYRSGSTEETFRITPLNDVDEIDEAVTVTIDDSSANFPAGYSLGAKSVWEVGIVDDDRDRPLAERDVIGFENPGVEVSEGGNINLFVELRDSGGAPITSVAEAIPLNLAVRDPDSDIDYAGGAASISPGSFFANGRVMIAAFNVRDDEVGEVEERIAVNLGEGQGFPGGDWGINPGANQFIITIAAEDNTITFGEPSSGSIPEEGGSAAIVANINQPIPSGNATVTVTPRAEDGDAERGTDYRLSVSGGSLSGNTWILPTGAGSATLTVTAVQDSDKEGEGEPLAIAFAEGALPDGWTAVAATHSVTVTDDDNTVEFASASGTPVLEDGTTTTTVTLDIEQPMPSSHTGTTTVSVGRAGSAVEGDDYTIGGDDYSGGVLTLRAGQQTATFTVTAVDDGDYDPGESITLSLSGLTGAPGGWSIGSQATHTIDITDDNLSGTFGFAATGNDTQTTEGATVRLTVAADQNTDVAVPVEWSVSPAEEVDSPASGRVEIPSGGNEAVITFTIANPAQADPELDKEITVTITDGNLNADDGWTLDNSAATHRITVLANDNTIGFADAESNIAEGGADATVNITVHHPLPSGATASVNVAATNNAGATSDDYTITGTDYSGGALTIREGQATATLTVTAVDDEDHDPGESVTLSLSGLSLSGVPGGWSLVSGTTHNVIIADDNLSGTFGFAATGNDTEAEEGATVRLTVATDKNTDVAVPIEWSVSPAEEVDSPASGRVEVPSGGNEAVITFTVADPAQADPEYEEEITVTIADGNLNANDGWTLDNSAATHSVTLPANDNTIVFGQPSPSSISEEGGTSAITATVNLPLPEGAVATVNVTEGGGVQEEDYIISGDGYENGVWTLTEGEESPMLTVSAVSNTNDQGGRTLDLTFDGATLPKGWSAVTTTRSITITDDDPTLVGFSAPDSSAVENDSAHGIPFVIEYPGVLPEFNITVSATGEVAAAGIAEMNMVSVGGANKTWTIENIPDNLLVGDGGKTIELEIQATDMPDDFAVDTTRNTHTLTIADNDTGTVQFAETQSRTSEQTAGPHIVQLEVSGAPTSPFNLVIETGGSARFGPDASDDANAAFPVRINSEGMFDIQVEIRDDLEPELDEEIVLTIPSGNNGLPDGFTVGENNNTHTITILLNDNIVSLAEPADARIEEGENANIVVEVTQPFLAGVTRPLNLIVGGNSGDIRFTPGTGTTYDGDRGILSLLPGQNRFEFTATANEEDGPELDEEVTFAISEHSQGLPEGWALGTTRQSITIAANENTVTFGAPSSPSISEEGGISTITANVNRPIPAGMTATVNVAPGGGAPGGDYTITGNGYANGVWTLPEGERNPTLTVEAVSNRREDNQRTLELTFTGATLPEGWSTASATRSITITDDDLEGTFGFASRNDTVAAEGGSISLMVASSAAPGANLVLGWTVNDDTDTDDDIDPDSGTVTIPANQDVGIFIVDITEDLDAELGEEITVTLVDRDAGDLFTPGDDTTHTFTIVAEDNTVEFATPTSATVLEEGEASTTVTLNIGQPIPSSHTGAVTIDIRRGGSADETADYAISGDDYSGGVLTLRAGERTATFTVTAMDDGDYDPDSNTVILSLSNLAGAPEGWGIGANDEFTIDITDSNRTGTFGFATNNISQQIEGEDVTLAIESSQNTDADVRVGWRISPASAISSSPASGTVVIPNGGNSATIPFTIADDDLPDGDERIEITLIDANTGDGWTLDGSAATHVVTVPANENMVTFASDTPRAVPETAGSVDIKVALSNAAPAEGLALKIEITGASENQVSFSNDRNSPQSTQTFTIEGGNDRSEDITLYFHADSNTVSETATLTLTANTDDSAFPAAWGTAPNVGRNIMVTEPRILGFITDKSDISEPANGNEEYTVDISADGILPASAFDLAVTVEGTAENPGDYTVSPSLNAVSVSSATVANDVLQLTFTVTADDVPEDAETILLSLPAEQPGLAGTGWSLGMETTHTINIAANDNFVGFANAPETARESAGNFKLPVRLSAHDRQDFAFTVTSTGEDYRGGALAAPADDAAHGSGIVFTTSQEDADTAHGHQHTLDLEVTVAQNDGPENAEKFTVTLELPGGVPEGFNSNLESGHDPLKHTFTIPAHDNTVTFATGNPASFDEGGGGQEVVLEFSDPDNPVPVPQDFSVIITSSGGESGDFTISTTPDDKYDPATGTLRLDAHDTAASFIITANEDGDAANERITLTLTGPNPPDGWEVPANETYSFDINDNAQTFEFAVNSSSAPENTSRHRIEINTTADIPADGLPVTLNVTGSSGDASYDADDGTGTIRSATLTNPQTVTIMPGNSAANPPENPFFLINLDDDNSAEADETVTFTIPSDAAVSTLPTDWTANSTLRSHSVTILASDNTVGFVDGSNTGTVAESALGTVQIPVSLTSPPPVGGLPVTIAITGGNESGVVSLAENEQRETRDIVIPDTATTSYDVTVYINEDDADFDDNDVVFTLSETAAATFPATWGVLDASTAYTLTVTENDALQTIGFATGASQANENESHVIELDTGFTIPREGFNFDLIITGTAEREDAIHRGREFFGGNFAVTIERPGPNPITGETPNPGFGINITDDGNPEDDDTFILVIDPESLPIGYVVGTIGTRENPHIFTIPGHDNTIGFAKSSIEVTEAADKTPSENVSVNLNIPAPIELKVALEILESDSGDEERADDITVSVSGGATFDRASGVLSIHQGTSSFDLVVTAVDDHHADRDDKEEVSITLVPDFGNPLSRGFSIDPGKNSLSVTVVNDDIATIGFAEPEIEVGEDAIKWVRSLINASQQIPSDVVLRIRFDQSLHERLAVARGTPRDKDSPLYKEVEIVFRGDGFVLNTDSTAFHLIPLDNEEVEGDISVDLVLEEVSNLPGNWRIGNHERMTVKILEDDGNGVSLAPDNLTEFREGQGSAEICLVASAGGVRTNLDARFISNGRFGTEETILTTFDSNGQNPTTAGGDVDFPTVGSGKDASVDFTFTEGDLKQCKRFVVNSDSDNFNEYFTLEIFDLDAVVDPDTASQPLNPANWGYVNLPIRHTFLVRDDDAGGSIGFTAAQSTITEAAGSTSSTTVTISIGQRLSSDSSVALTLGGSVTAHLRTDYTITGRHYDPTKGILTLPANTESVSLTIRAVDDIILDPDETVTLTIAERSGENALPPGWKIDGHATHTVSITDNESGISFRTHREGEVVSNAGSRITSSVTEGERIDILLSMVPPLEQTQEVYLEFSNSSFFNTPYPVSMEIDGMPASFDVLNRLVLTLPANRDRIPLTIIANEDGDEDQETLTISISEHASALPQGLKILEPKEYTVNVIDNDAPVGTVYFAKRSDIVDEVEATRTVELVIDGYTLRSAGENLGMTITGSEEGEIRDVTLGGLPLADPTVLPGATGEDNARFTIDIEDDSHRESDEQITFTLPSRVTLSGGEELAVGSGVGKFNTYTLTIRASDNIVRFASPDETVTEDVGKYVLSVNLDDHGAPDGGLPLTLTASGDTDAVLFDNNITVREGERTADATVFIGHDMDGDSETVSFTLGEGANFPSEWGGIPAGTNTHTLHITDEGIPPGGLTIGFESGSATVVEPNDNRNDRSASPEIKTIDHIVKLKISGGIPEGGHTLPISIRGSANASDFTAPSEVILPEAIIGSEVEFTVAIREDSLPEGIETIILGIDEKDLPDGYKLATPAHIITIPANDRWVGISPASTTIDEPLEDLIDLDGDGFPDGFDHDPEQERKEVMLRIFVQQRVPAPLNGIPLKLMVLGAPGDFSFDRNSQSANIIDVLIPQGRTEINVPFYIANDADINDEGLAVDLLEGDNFPHDWGLIPRHLGSASFLVNDVCACNQSLIGFTEASSTALEGDTATDHHVRLSYNAHIPFDPTFPRSGFRIRIKVETSSTAVNDDIRVNGESLSHSSGPGNDGIVDVFTVAHDFIHRGVVEPGSWYVPFTIQPDSAPEEDETLTITISRPPRGWGVVGNHSHTITIPANDNTVGFASDAATTLDESGAGVQLVVRLAAPAPEPIMLNVTTGGTAVKGTDYSIEPPILTIDTGRQDGIITLRGISDDKFEGRKSIELAISGNLPDTWEFRDTEHTLTLLDDENRIFFAADAPRSLEEPPGFGNASHRIAVDITEAPRTPITMQISMVGRQDENLATLRSDYVLQETEVTFEADGSLRQSIPLYIQSDSIPELDESIILQLSDVDGSRAAEGSGYLLGEPHTITIPANDNIVGFALNAPTALNENSGITQIGVGIDVNNPAPVPIMLNIDTSGTARVGEDYSISSSPLMIPANQGSGTITLTSMDDDQVEGDELIELTISAGGALPDGWTFGTETHNVILADDELSVFFAGDAPRLLEEPEIDNESTMITVGITRAPSAPVTVKISAGGEGESATSGDYTFTETNITFAADDNTNNNLRQTIPLVIHPDDIPELDKSIVLTISDVDGSQEAEGEIFALGGTHTITIPANDNAIGFASDALTMLHENGVTTEIGVGVNVNNPAPVPITLNIATDGTATEGEDYSILPSSLTIPAGQSSGTITLTSINDSNGEGNEFIELTISASGALPPGWTLGTATHNVTLKDDEHGIFFVADVPRSIEEPRLGSVDTLITVVITRAPSAPVTVMVSGGGEGENATSGDYTLTATNVTFAANDNTSNNLRQTIPLVVHSDNTPELDESIVLTISDVDGSRAAEGSGLALGGTHTITIPVNDNAVGFASDALTTLDENTGTTEISVGVNVNNPAPAPIMLNITTGGTATEEEDYNISSSSLMIPAGQSGGSITLTSINDNISEGNEFIELTVSISGTLPPGWALGTATHYVTLIDDELNISFSADVPRLVEEPSGSASVSYPVTVGITQAPSAPVAVRVLTGGEGETASSSSDYIFGECKDISLVRGEDCERKDVIITFAANDNTVGNLRQTVNIAIRPDRLPEPDETIVLTLVDDVTGFRAAENGGFVLGGPHTITIPVNDNIIGFFRDDSGAMAKLRENRGLLNIWVNVHDPAPVPITLHVTTSGTAKVGTDYTISDTSLTIPAGQASPPLPIILEGINNDKTEGDKTITLTLSGDLPDGWSFYETERHVVIEDDD